MKAKEYADLYKANPDNYAALSHVFNAMYAEVLEIAKTRHVSTNPGMIAVIKEIDLKWRAFVRLSGDPSIKPDGFITLTVRQVPELRPFFDVEAQG